MKETKEEMEGIYLEKNTKQTTLERFGLIFDSKQTFIEDFC